MKLTRLFTCLKYNSYKVFDKGKFEHNTNLFTFYCLKICQLFYKFSDDTVAVDLSISSSAVVLLLETVTTFVSVLLIVMGSCTTQEISSKNSC